MQFGRLVEMFSPGRTTDQTSFCYADELATLAVKGIA